MKLRQTIRRSPLNIQRHGSDLLHLLENTFDRKRVSTNLNSKPNPTLTAILTLNKVLNCFWTDETRHFSSKCTDITWFDSWLTASVLLSHYFGFLCKQLRIILEANHLQT